MKVTIKILNELFINKYKIYLHQETQEDNKIKGYYTNGIKSIWVERNKNNNDIYLIKIEESIYARTNNNSVYIDRIRSTNVILINKIIDQTTYHHINQNGETIQYTYTNNFDNDLIKYEDTRGNYWDKYINVDNIFQQESEIIEDILNQDPSVKLYDL